MYILNLKVMKENKSIYRFGAAMLTAVGMLNTRLGAYGQTNNLGNQFIQDTANDLKTATSNILFLIKLIMGIVGAILLVVAAAKLMKGEQQAAKNIIYWVAGIAVFFILLSVLQNKVLKQANMDNNI